MIDNKIFSGGGLNSDDDLHLFPKNDWIDAENIRVNSTAVGYLGSAVNIKGTEFISGYTPTEFETIIGARGFDNARKIFYFIFDGNGYNKILEYNAETGLVSVLVTDLTDTADIPVLKFSGTADNRIYDIDLLDNRFLFWHDKINPPRVLDLEKDYGVFTEQSISVVKYAPLAPPSNLEVIDDCTINSNKIKNKNYQFKYRWIYWDNSYSAFSPISNMSNQKGRASGVLSFGLLDWYESALKFNFEGGGSLVKGYEIITREGNTGDWVVIDSTEYALADSRIGYGVRFIFTSGNNDYNISVTYNGTTYSFGSTYTPFGATNLYEVVKSNFNSLGLTDLTIELSDSNSPASQEQFLYITSVNRDVEFTIQTSSPRFTTITQNSFLLSNETTNTFVFSSLQGVSIIDQAEANRPFSYVPLIARAQCMPNGNYLTYGNYTEGYDNVDINATAELSISSVVYPPQLDVLVTTSNDRTRFEFNSFYGSGEFSFSLTKHVPNSDQYTVSIMSNIQNETLEEFIQRIVFVLKTYYEIPSIVTNVTSTSFDIESFNYRYIAAILSTNTKQSLKSGDEYQYGIVYFDAAGRYGAVQTSPSMIIKTDPLDIYRGTGNKWLSGMVTIKSRPPVWAHKYAIVRTKRKKKDFFLQMFVDFITFGPVTALVDLQTSINKYNDRYGTDISYSWVQGDRIQFVYENSPNSGSDIVYDTAITGIDSNNNLIVASSGVPKITLGNDNGFVEVYRESSVSNAELFWEISEFGSVGNIGEVDAYHIRIYDTGSNQTQNSVDPSGVPLIHYSETGDVWFKQRFLPSPTPQEENYRYYKRAWCESPSFSDFNANAFTSDIGRANIQNAFEKQTTYPATVRYSQAYVPGTQINNISTFNEESYQDYSNMYGPIQKLDIDGNKMIVGQKLRVGSVFVFKNLIVDQNNSTLLSNSDKLLNEIVYFAYEAGIGDSPESYVRWGDSKYFIDKRRGLVCRLANNGITPISSTAKMNTFFRNNLRDRTFLPCGYDPTNDEYLISFIGESGYSMVFSESSNRFTSKFTLAPSYFATLEQDLYCFSSGLLFKLNATTEYNKFFDNQYDSTITIVSNDSPTIKKSFVAVSEIANDLWDIPEITTDLSQESRLSANKFARLEGEYHASFMRDASVTPGVTDPLFNGNKLKGKWIKLKMKNSNTDFVYLLSVGVKSIISPQTGV